MKRLLAPLALLATLSGCNILFPGDPRSGVEDVEDCIERLGDEPRSVLFDRVGLDSGQVIPTYTFDVTKMGGEDLRTLIVPGSDETAGSRAMALTKNASTAIDNFMRQPVDDKGAFFFGNDPALYRVRGGPVALDAAVSTGCARQLPGMRLINVTADVFRGDPQSEDETS
ncbi:MAG: hypothetical protein AAF697_00435 [Pseudomonadota bacterium]